MAKRGSQLVPETRSFFGVPKKRMSLREHLFEVRGIGELNAFGGRDRHSLGVPEVCRSDADFAKAPRRFGG